jgi:AraC-like DNA-binding protein
LEADPTLAPLPRNLLDAIEEAGLVPESIAREAGVAPERLETGMAFGEADRFLTAAWTALRDPAFGLRAGSRLRPERFGLVGLAAMSSPDLGTALERKARYGRLIWGDAYELHKRGDRATLRVASSWPQRPYSQARIDMELASLLAFSRLVTGSPVQALEVTLRQPRPSYAGAYDAMFRCPVAFDAPDDALVLASADLALPLVSRDSTVGRALVETAEALLGRLDPGGDGGFRSRATQAVRRLVRGSEPTLAAVARELCISERTLQRRLAEIDLSFTALLDGVRHEAALDYLRERRITAEEVAFLLGFADPSSFFRAFKRWTGQTPEGWRRASLALRS